MFFQDLLILLLAVWIVRKLFQAVHFPSLFGEIFTGILVGPLLLGWVHETEAIKVLAELGIFFLMFHSGLESDPKDLFKVSKNAMGVALGGLILSVLGGYFASLAFGLDPSAAFFVGMSLSITAVAISARLFKDNKMVRSKVAHTVMAAALITEILVLVIFSLFLEINQSGEFDPAQITVILLKFLFYFLAIFYVGHNHFGSLYKVIYKGNKGFTFSIIIALAFAVVGELIGLHFIIGAFFAGLFLHSGLFEESVYNKIEDRAFGLSYSFLAPVFFASLAFHLDFTALTQLPIYTLVILIIAVAAKIIGSGLPAYWSGMNKERSFAVGLAMNSRGAVELILASIGLQAGIIDAQIFSLLVIVSFVTTLITILGIKPMAPKLKK